MWHSQYFAMSHAPFVVGAIFVVDKNTPRASDSWSAVITAADDAASPPTCTIEFYDEHAQAEAVARHLLRLQALDEGDEAPEPTEQFVAARAARKKIMFNVMRSSLHSLTSKWRDAFDVSARPDIEHDGLIGGAFDVDKMPYVQSGELNSFSEAPRRAPTASFEGRS